MVRKTLLKVLAKEFDVDPATVTDNTKLKEDLDLQPFDILFLLEAVYKKVKFTIDFNDPKNKMSYQTFGELVTAIEQNKA